MGAIAVILSRTFGPMTGAMPTPPPDMISFIARITLQVITIFELDPTQHGLSVIFEDVTGVNDG
jgi:hypothetical protein